MPFKSKLKNKVLSGQCRELVSNILRFMEAEAITGEISIPLAKVQERVAKATGISIRTIRNVKSEMKKTETGESEMFLTPNKKRLNRKSSVTMDESDLGVLRRCIINYHITEKRVPTLRVVHKKLAQDIGYQGSRETLRKEIHKIGFRWRKVKTNRKVLMERQPIRLLRIEFLKKMRAFRKENRPIIYMDETYIHGTHTHQKGWSDETMDGLHKPVSKGQRLIIIHAGSENGFVPNAYIRWKSNSNTGDYHNDMNFENYKKWVSEQLIPNLPPRSVVVIDNAPYHNKQIDKMPTTLTRKADMQAWLKERNISFDPKMLKPQLYGLIKNNKPKYKRFEIDQLFIAANHDVLRLPPYHPDLNPIELVWADLKEYVAKRNVTFNFNDVMQHCDNFFTTFSAEQWKSRCERAKRFEEEFISNEPRIDTIIDDMIIRLHGEGSDTETESENEFEDLVSEDEGSLSGIEELSDQDEIRQEGEKSYFNL